MFLASILAVCLRLGAAPNTLPQATIVSLAQTNEANAHKSVPWVMLAQNAPPAQNAESSKASSEIASPTTTPPSVTKTNPAPSSVHKKRKRRKPASQSQKVVVRNGSTTDPSVQFSTTASPEQATHDRQKTAGLLATTQANLQRLSGRQLSTSQQDTLTEIRGYMQQAKAAEDAGDLQSAQNLALKAQLLSADLVQK